MDAVAHTRPMIRFKCSFCGGLLRVANTCAGRRGRCPACQKVVDIPGLQSGDTHGLSALVNAISRDSLPEDSAVRPAPPPPVKKEDTAVDETSISTPAANPSFETDILPADQSEIGDGKPAEPRAGMMHLRPVVSVPKRKKETRPQSRSRLGRIILMLVVLAMVAAAIVAFYFALRRR